MNYFFKDAEHKISPQEKTLFYFNYCMIYNKKPLKICANDLINESYQPACGLLDKTYTETLERTSLIENEVLDYYKVLITDDDNNLKNVVYLTANKERFEDNEIVINDFILRNLSDISLEDYNETIDLIERNIIYSYPDVNLLSIEVPNNNDDFIETLNNRDYSIEDIDNIHGYTHIYSKLLRNLALVKTKKSR